MHEGKEFLPRGGLVHNDVPSVANQRPHPKRDLSKGTIKRRSAKEQTQDEPENYCNSHEEDKLAPLLIRQFRNRDAREKKARGSVHQAAGLELRASSSDPSDYVGEDAGIGTELVSGQTMNKHRVDHSSRRSVDRREKPRERYSTTAAQATSAVLLGLILLRKAHGADP